MDASAFVQGAGPAATLSRIFDRNWGCPCVTGLWPGGGYPPPRIQ